MKVCNIDMEKVNAEIDEFCRPLTSRELWLMRKAWVEGQNYMFGMDEWLEDMAADGVTVEMALAKEAPKPF